LDEEIRKVNDQEATAVAVDYMHQAEWTGRSRGPAAIRNGRGKWYVVDPVFAEKAKQDTIAAAKFYLGCRNLLAAENCQA